MRALEERFFDVALEEVLGKVTPPDLTHRILGLAQQRLAEPGTEKIGGQLLRLPPVKPVREHRRVLGWSTVLPSLAICGLLLWGGTKLLPDPSVRRGEAIATVEVLQGEFQWTGRASTLRAGDSLQLRIAVGDRLRCGRDPAILRIGSFHALYTRPETTMEILSMRTSRRNGAIAISGMTLAVVAGAVAWNQIFGTDRAEAGQVVDLEEPVSGMPEPGQEMLAKLAGDKEALQRRVEELELQLSREAVEPPAPDSEPVDDEPAEQQVRFTTDKYRQALAAVDWKRFGSTTAELSRVNGEIAEHSLDGGEVPRELLAKHKQLSGLLLELSKPLMDGEIPGEGGNGTFSHPLVLANSVDFSLAAAGMALDQGQMDVLQRVAQHYAAQDENLRIAAESQELASESFLAEMNMKRNLYGEIREALSPEQQQLLFPDAQRGRSQIELFGVGGDWGAFARTVAVRGPEEYTDVMTVSFQSGLGLSKQQTAQVRTLLDRYARSYPPSYWEQKSSDLDRRGFMETSRIHEVAERQIRLLRDILQNVNLTPDQRDALAKTRRVFVPLPR